MKCTVGGREGGSVGRAGVKGAEGWCEAPERAEKRKEVGGRYERSRAKDTRKRRWRRRSTKKRRDEGIRGWVLSY